MYVIMVRYTSMVKRHICNGRPNLKTLSCTLETEFFVDAGIINTLCDYNKENIEKVAFLYSIDIDAIKEYAADGNAARNRLCRICLKEFCAKNSLPYEEPDNRQETVQTPMQEFISTNAPRMFYSYPPSEVGSSGVPLWTNSSRRFSTEQDTSDISSIIEDENVRVVTTGTASNGPLPSAYIGYHGPSDSYIMPDGSRISRPEYNRRNGRPAPNC